MSRQYKADLRVFGAIGFQDLWLQKQDYPNTFLMSRIFENSAKKNIDIVGIASEDDKMLPGFPEDRFGFLKRAQLVSRYFNWEETEKGVIRVRDNNGKEAYIVNCETRHPDRERGQDWKGLKLHVVGGNLLSKHLDLEDAVKDANDRGYMTFLMGPAYHASQKVLDECTGIITHDANNTFDEWMIRLPVIGKRLASYSRTKNKSAENFANENGKPGISVSSAHWMHEIGNAHISFQSPLDFRLKDLKDAIKRKKFDKNQGHNSRLDVFKFGRMLSTYGGSPNRFEGTLSSYNEPNTEQ